MAAARAAAEVPEDAEEAIEQLGEPVGLFPSFAPEGGYVDAATAASHLAGQIEQRPDCTQIGAIAYAATQVASKAAGAEASKRYNASGLAGAALVNAIRSVGNISNSAGWTEEAAQCHLLRDIVGYPFRPLPCRSFPAHVVGLAQSCYETFPTVSEQYAILADALEDLGEAKAANHCRGPVHTKGCHILDWILGKG